MVEFVGGNITNADEQAKLDMYTNFYQNTSSSALSRASLLTSLDAWLDLIENQNSSERLLGPNSTYGPTYAEAYNAARTGFFNYQEGPITPPPLPGFSVFGGKGWYHQYAENGIHTTGGLLQDLNTAFGTGDYPFKQFLDMGLTANQIQAMGIPAYEPRDWSNPYGDNHYGVWNKFLPLSPMASYTYKQGVWDFQSSIDMTSAQRALNAQRKIGVTDLGNVADPNWRPEGYDQWLSNPSMPFHPTIKLEHYFKTATEFQQYWLQNVAKFERAFGISAPGQKTLRAEENKRIMDNFRDKYDTRRNPTLDRRRGASGGGAAASVTQLSGQNRRARSSSVTLLG